jgi:hypothetical protein
MTPGVAALMTTGHGGDSREFWHKAATTMNNRSCNKQIS